MLDAAVEPTPAAAAEDAGGIVGTRQLVCVQTFDIARLTSHPVALIPSRFVAIGGRGPTDSNDSSKTSFLAATSLLLGDPEWGMTGGGVPAVADLLFEPNTAGVSAERYLPARHGYVIGVFCETEAPDETALTVWCRLNATAEYFQARYLGGVRLVEGSSDADRHRNADADWDRLPAATQLGAKHYAERLYGDSPRCLAYVSERGRRQSKPSLLQMNAGAFTPEEIGQDLIRLTGRAGAFTAEEAQRERLDSAQRKLVERESAHESQRRQEEDDLRWVLARNGARAHLATAEREWRLHFARGFLDVLVRQGELEAEHEEATQDVSLAKTVVEEAEAQLAELSVPEELQSALTAAEVAYERRYEDMREAEKAETEARTAVGALEGREREHDAAADGWDGRSADDVAVELASRKDDALVATERLGAARSDVREAEARLSAAQAGAEGRAGETAALLADAGIAAAPLMDVELAEAARSVWEPRLTLFADAVVVTPGNIDAAQSACAEAPGSVLIAGEDAALPGGITAAPPGAGRFLTTLAARRDHLTAPERALDDELALTVIGGFDKPQTGRAARIARAQAALEGALAEFAAAEEASKLAAGAVEVAAGALARAQAAAQLTAVRRQLVGARKVATDAADAVGRLVGPLKAADKDRTEADAKVRGHEQLRSAAEERLQGKRKEHATAVAALGEVDRKRENLQAEYWRRSWGDSIQAAEVALEGDGRQEKTMRNRAAAVLQDALNALGIRSDGTGAPTPELDQVARRRSLLEEDPTRGRVPATLEEVGRPLRDYLDTHEDMDLVVEERITRQRSQREAELELARDECGGLDSALRTLQDGVEQRIRQALDGISAEYDRLSRESGRWGAELDIQARRPEGPQDRWRWAVTPRWRRAPGGRQLPYDNQANSAQRKMATVQLVLAALLAAPNPRGRVLVLDELGDSLGVSNRREVLREISETAKAKAVTVLGTCQDSVLADATGYCGELVYFEYPGVPEALNRPTRAYGFDDNGDRILLTADALREGRPWV
jgi:hypothetical protein